MHDRQQNDFGEYVDVDGVAVTEATYLASLDLREDQLRQMKELFEQFAEPLVNVGGSTRASEGMPRQVDLSKVRAAISAGKAGADLDVNVFEVFFGASMRRHGPSLVSTFGPGLSADARIVVTEAEYSEAITTIEFKMLNHEPIFKEAEGTQQFVRPSGRFGGDSDDDDEKLRLSVRDKNRNTAMIVSQVLNMKDDVAE